MHYQPKQCVETRYNLLKAAIGLQPATYICNESNIWTCVKCNVFDCRYRY